jgi:hypothetical protein
MGTIFNGSFAEGASSKTFNVSLLHVVPSGDFIIEYTPHEDSFFLWELHFPYTSPPAG